MADFLDKVRVKKLEEVAALEGSEQLRRALAAKPLHGPNHFVQSLLSGAPMALIAEVKRASPSKGIIHPDLDAAERARLYTAAGASAVSVLTEPHWFHGTLGDLRAAADATPLPVIRKDFILHESQIDMAVAAGASAVLLIVAFLTPERLAELHGYAVSRGLGVLVEIHGESELDAALGADARVIGVNARDLKTLKVDRQVVLDLGPRLVEAGVAVAVAESGIFEQAHTQAAYDAGFRAALVGESLVRASDPAGLASELKAVRP